MRVVIDAARRQPSQTLTEGMTSITPTQVEIMLEQAGSIEELREMFFSAFPDVDASGFASAIAEAMIAADAGGRALVEAESG